MTTSASAELNVIKSVQINSSSQSIAGTLRPPKSSLLAMVLVPLARGSRPLTPNPRLGFRRKWENIGHAGPAIAGAVCRPGRSEESCDYLIGCRRLITGGANSQPKTLAV